MISKRLASTILAVFVALLAMQGARDVAARIIFPAVAVRFDPLRLLGERVEAAYIPSIIKNVQYFSITLSGASSNTATITSVTTANAVAEWLGDNAGTATPTQSQVQSRVSLTNSTTVTANTGAAVNSVVKGVVVEFRSGWIKSNTQYNVAATSASTTKTITSVTTSKAYIVYQGFNDTSGNTSFDATCTRPALTLTNSTTVTATWDSYNPGGCGTATAYFDVLEFN